MLYTMLYTPLWAFGNESTYVHPCPPQSKSNQNPLTQPNYANPTRNDGGTGKDIKPTHIVGQLFVDFSI